MTALPDFRRWSSAEMSHALLSSRMACECEAIEREMQRRGEITAEQLANSRARSWPRARQMCCGNDCQFAGNGEKHGG